jgi:hypothetical protein
MPARDILDVEVVVNKIEDDAAFSAPLQRLGFRRFNPPTSRPPTFACLSQKMAAAASMYMSASLAASSTADMSELLTHEDVAPLDRRESKMSRA